PARRVTFRFHDRDGRTISHWNKLLKGSLVRWLLTEQPVGPEDLSAFDHPLGYRFDAAASALEGSVASVVLRQAP
ncbi:MAG: peroxide stress protein YaaA, partial [Acidimicrobiales bacterium]